MQAKDYFLNRSYVSYNERRSSSRGFRFFLFRSRAEAIDDCAKDGGEEFFTEMQCVLLSNSYRIVKDLRLERDASR